MSGNTNFEDIYTELGTEQYSKLCTSLGMGGLWLGYSFNHQKPVHFAVSIKSGIGALSVYPKNFERNDYSWVYNDIVGMVEPEVQVELNLFRWWRMQFGVGYRYVFNIEDDTYFNAAGENKRYFENNDFSTPTIGFSMLFGNFGLKNDKN
ncbi:MAG: hypothetical protein PHU27_02700 [Salinivirgaceae bacterium]|nr:hypothetical protein [Salinivirgaceae bacterium]